MLSKPIADLEECETEAAQDASATGQCEEAAPAGLEGAAAQEWIASCLLDVCFGGAQFAREDAVIDGQMATKAKASRSDRCTCSFGNFRPAEGEEEEHEEEEEETAKEEEQQQDDDRDVQGVAIDNCDCQGCATGHSGEGFILRYENIMYATSADEEACVAKCKQNSECVRILLRSDGCFLFNKGARGLRSGTNAEFCWVKHASCTSNPALNCHEVAASLPESEPECLNGTRDEARSLCRSALPGESSADWVDACVEDVCAGGPDMANHTQALAAQVEEVLVEEDNLATGSCHTCSPGDLCFDDVSWAMEVGISAGFYKGEIFVPEVDEDSCFEEVQRALRLWQHDEALDEWTAGMGDPSIPASCHDAEDMAYQKHGLTYCR